jgi:SAM-dependent methyltransferase
MSVSGHGFERNALKSRYDVCSISEDRWHTHTGQRTSRIVANTLAEIPPGSRRLLNAGSGCHALGLSSWEEIATDLFPSPLTTHRVSVCASVELLPFAEQSFGAVVSVGEVLAYCDPARALKEFARVLIPSGVLICDFGSTRSTKYRFTESFGRAADLVTDRYNGSPEKIWIYDPLYIRSILEDVGFLVSEEMGIHAWSAIARRLGLSPAVSVLAGKLLDWIRAPAIWGDIMTVVARRQPI